ncbi:hypothetical protein AVEN_122253-1 [Araneus ventricosus]|uniref:RNase H type-1 domain-containing protein n=1 Tax=Araneus ventricosus TaxID=182803 RepID=A0A4Y2RFI6_ARAVE|nr:hypothetical protein AVEN_122253-1 [Araneus ventricosus]
MDDTNICVRVAILFVNWIVFHVGLNMSVLVAVLSHFFIQKNTSDSSSAGIFLLNSSKATEHCTWIPSHVNLKYNGIADGLAKEGTTMPQANVEPLTYLELYSRRKAFVNISWRHPPAHS